MKSIGQRIIACKPEGNYRVWVRFRDGLEGIVDLSDLKKVPAFKEVWKTREDFNRVRVEPLTHTVTWGEKKHFNLLRSFTCIPKQTQKLEFCQSQRPRFNPIEVAPIQMDRCDAEGVKDGDVGEGKNQLLSLFGYKWMHLLTNLSRGIGNER